MAIVAVAALALAIALKSPASGAQALRQIALQASGETQTVASHPAVPAASASGAAPDSCRNAANDLEIFRI